MFCSLIYKTQPRFNIIRKYSSALYITGEKASQHCAVLTPVTNFEQILNQQDIFKDNIKSRALDINLEQVIQRWEFFQDLDNKKQTMEKTRSEIGRYVSYLMKEKSNDNEEIDKWKLQSKLIKDALKNLKIMYYNIEEDVHLQILSLPNILHEKTPRNNAVLVHEYKTKPELTSKSHLQIAQDSVNYINPFCCYLNSEPALFEISILKYLRKTVQNLNYSEFSSPDFSRSVVVEGCGEVLEDASAVFTLEEPHEKEDTLNKLHLTGGSALEAYMAYFTKHFVQPNAFPLQYFAMGRKYQPYKKDWPEGLFNLCQESTLNVFVAYLENENDLFLKLQTMLINFYDSLNYHYKMEILPAKDLGNSEALRLSVQMYSNNLDKYIEVGNISLYDEYISKRLLFTTNVEKERAFPKILFGTLLNVHKFLGCAIENNSVDKGQLLDDTLRKFMFV